MEERPTTKSDEITLRDLVEELSKKYGSLDSPEDIEAIERYVELLS